MLIEMIDEMNAVLENTLNGVYKKTPAECLNMVSSLKLNRIRTRIPEEIKALYDDMKQACHLTFKTNNEFVSVYVECVPTEDQKTEVFMKYFIDID